MTHIQENSHQVLPDVWVVRVGLVTFVVLITMTLLIVWLVVITRWKEQADDFSDDGHFDSVIQQQAVNPMMMSPMTESIFWKKSATTPGSSGSASDVNASNKSDKQSGQVASSQGPSNLVLNTSTRGKFAILGEDDSDNDESHPEETNQDIKHRGSSSDNVNQFANTDARPISAGQS